MICLYFCPYFSFTAIRNETILNTSNKLLTIAYNDTIVCVMCIQSQWEWEWQFARKCFGHVCLHKMQCWLWKKAATIFRANTIRCMPCHVAEAIAWCGVSTTAHHTYVLCILQWEQRAPVTANAIKINSFIARTHSTVLIDDDDRSEFICVLLCTYLSNCTRTFYCIFPFLLCFLFLRSKIVFT